MSDYGTHPTQYGDLNKDALYAMYRETVYSKLSENEKLALLQETVNRDAMERGELGSPKVKFAEMASNVSGNTANGVISVNRDIAVKGIQTVEYQGRTINHPIDDYNIQTLNTVLHENIHCFQDQVIDGTIQIDNPQLTAEYSANHFTESIVFQNQNYQLGSQYLTGETTGGYYMYYFQATERDAYFLAEKKTEDILQGIVEKHGMEPSFSAYAKSVTATGYEAREREAIQLFQNTDFVKDLNQTLQNQYYGTNKPVNPRTENAVKTEMIETNRAMYLQIKIDNLQAMKEENQMNFDYKPVTLDEYNQSLRDTVNAFYSHSINDPNMSKEDALKSTGEMAEKYLEAVEEFQEAQNVQIQSSTVENATDEIHSTNTLNTENSVETEVNSSVLSENGAETTADIPIDNDGIDDGEDCEDGLDP